MGRLGGIPHVVFDRGGLGAPAFRLWIGTRSLHGQTGSTGAQTSNELTGPPLCPWVQVRFHGVLAPNSRYREIVTLLSARKVERDTVDVEADGREEPNPRAGKRKGLCCILKGIKAKRLKRQFNIDVSVCSACGGPMRIIAESRTTALKIRWSSAKYCRTWKREAAPHRQGQQSVLLEYARRRQGFASPHKSHGRPVRDAQCILHKREAGRGARLGQWLRVRD